MQRLSDANGANLERHLPVAKPGGVSSATPVAVSGSGPGGLVFESISAGFQHTCGLVVGRSVYCWGENRFGEVGDASTSMRNVPAKVSGSGGGALQFIWVSAGGGLTCATTTAFAAWCWGDGSSGKLGNPASASTVPVQVTGSGVGTLRFEPISAGSRTPVP